MYKLYPYFTNDGSTGLYSEADNDIYHSTYGALTEAYEKFILPAELEKFFEKYSEIKILDICFGIGYNTKSFLNFFYNAQIYTDNINNTKYTDELHTDNTDCLKSLHEAVKNKKIKIYIKAIDTDKILAGLSPFVICDKKNLPKNYKLTFNNEKIKKLLNRPPKYKIKFYDEINYILMHKIAENNPDIYENEELYQILTDRKYTQFFEKIYAVLLNFDKNGICFYTPLRRLSMFLHNI